MSKQFEKAYLLFRDKGEIVQYDPEMHGATQSSLNTYMDCQKKARYYLRGLKSTGGSMSPALIFGSVFHDFQEHILDEIKAVRISHSGDVDNMILEMSLDIFNEKWKPVYDEADPKGQVDINYAFAFMEELIPRYFKFYAADFEKMKYTEVEGEFKVHIHKVPIKGKRDGIFTLYNAGRNVGEYLMEHKTKSKIDIDAIEKSMPFNYQNNVYRLAYHLETGKRLKGVCYNMIRKPALRKKVSESTSDFIIRCMEDIDKRPYFYFVRVWDQFKPETSDEFAKGFSNQVLKFKMWSKQAEEMDIRNTSKCMNMFGGVCPYLHYCMSNETDHAGLEIKEKLFSELG